MTARGAESVEADDGTLTGLPQQDSSSSSPVWRSRCSSRSFSGPLPDPFGPVLLEKDRSTVSLKTTPNAPSADGEQLIEINGPLTVTELAQRLNVAPQDIQRELMNLGILANLNAQVTVENATKVAEKKGYLVVSAAPAPRGGNGA